MTISDMSELESYDASEGLDGIRRRAEAASAVVMKMVWSAETLERAAPAVLVGHVCTKDVPYLLHVVAGLEARVIELRKGCGNRECGFHTEDWG
jgi:hypothetical protein